MILKNKPVLIRRILILASFAIVSGILWNTYIFFQEFKQEERAKMEVYAEAVVEVNQNSLKDDLIFSASTLAKRGGTAFPICLYWLPFVPKNSKVSGKL